MTTKRFFDAARTDAGRRRFLARAFSLREIEIAGVLVQALPRNVETVASALEAMEGTEIHQRDASGKLVVVIEASTVDAIGARLHEIALLPGVLSANLAFHATDRA